VSGTDQKIAQSLKDISRYLGDIANGMHTLNENFVAFHKYLKDSDESYDELVSGKGPMMVPREAEDVRFVDDEPLDQKEGE
jgi:DNA anti-recombination protein RmuC